MQMNPVTSSNIEAVGYDAPTRTLGVKFKSGGVYHYHDVPAHAHLGLIGSESVGGFFAKHIVGKFQHTKRKEQP